MTGVFYSTKLHKNSFHAVASFGDGTRVDYRVQAKDWQERERLILACQQHAEDLAKVKEVSLG